MYIITGSSTPAEKSKIFHSGAGRFFNLKMYTLSFAEITNDKKIYLEDLFNNILFEPFISKYDINWIIEHLIIGGWPESISKNKYNPLIIKQYIESIINIDTMKINSLRSDKKIMNRLLQSIARLNSSELKGTTIQNDLNSIISINTLRKYIEVLEDIRLIDYLEPWSLNVRSKTRVRTTPKMYLCDPSIGLSLLLINSKEKLITDLKILGIYFENQVIKDLKVYCQTIGADLFFYRTEAGYEVDIIIQMYDGRWGAIEIKLGETEIEKAANNLIKLEDKIIIENGIEKKPSFLAIIYSGKNNYIRKDGVLVISHTSLSVKFE